jgi:hypothetical protein
MKKVSGVPDGELVVSMGQANERVVVATNKHVYVMGNDFIMRRVVFETQEKEDSPFENRVLAELKLRAERGIKINTNGIKDMLVPSQKPTWKFFVGAKLYFYEGGVVVPNRVIYSDQALSHAIPNPVIADCNGNFPAIFIKPDDGPYKIGLADSRDVMLLMTDYYVTNGE